MVSTVNSLSRLLNMPINHLNVIKLLLVVFQSMNIPDSEVNDAEQKLANHFQEILIQAMKADQHRFRRVTTVRQLR